MALVVSVITPDLKLFPLAGLQDIPRERSDVPRQQLIFSVLSSTVAGAGVGDNQGIRIDLALPQRFSYVFMDFFMLIRGASAGVTNSFDSIGRVNLNDDVSGGNRSYLMLRSCVSPGASPINGLLTKCYAYDGQLPSVVIAPPPGAAAQVTVEVTNSVDDDQDYVVQAAFRFMVYDINQTNHYQVNTPQLVR